MGKDQRGVELGKGFSQRKDGYYLARFTDPKGKRISITSLDLEDLKERFEREKEQSYFGGLSFKMSYTIGEWYDFWLDNIKKPAGLTSAYLDRLQYVYKKYIVEKSRDIVELKQIKPINIQIMINEAEQDSHSAALTLHTLLKQMFTYAYENELIRTNPSKAIHLHKGKRRATEAMSMRDEKVLLENITSQAQKDMVIFLLNTGLRISEFLGLTFDEVHLSERYIEINHQISHKRDEKGEFRFVPTKNKKSRVVPLNKKAYDILKKTIEERKPKLGREYRTKSAISDDLVFVSKWGDAYVRTGFNSIINYAIRKAKDSGYVFDCPRLSPHIFRHTFATRCLEAGMAPTTVSSLLGHGSVRMTLQYVHNSKNRFAEDTKLLNNI